MAPRGKSWRQMGRPDAPGGGRAAHRSPARRGQPHGYRGPLGRPSGPARMSGFTAPHCGSLRATDVGRELELFGWVGRRRDHGGLIFLELRHRVNKVIHAYMDEHEFVEVETPLLVKGTPEGARDFVVPSRLHHGEFFALPQSPQQLKQLLMVSGLGRYYQIARCLRDEDLRADRALEFTQLDLEMSFCDEEDVFTLIEGLWARIWKEILDVDLVIPFPRLDMKETLLRYGTDKPDLRYELEIADLGEVLAQTGAQVFKTVLAEGGVVRGFAVPGGKVMTRRVLDDLSTIEKGAGAKGLAWLPGPLDKYVST